MATTPPSDIAAELPPDSTLEINVPLDMLKRHPRNPRKGNKEKIRASIKAHGFADVVIAQASTRHVIAGWHRTEVAREEGYEVAPIVIWQHVDDETAERRMLAYNKASDDAEYDLAILRDVLRDLDASADGLGDTLYDSDELLDLRRVTGDLADANTDFLGKIHTPDPSAEAGEARGDALRLVVSESTYSLTFPFDLSEREDVLAAVRAAKAELADDATSAAAMAHIARQYVEQHATT